MPGSGMSPCAACKLLRRRCTKDCIFAPYFPPDEPQKFAYVHKVFGASNVSKMLQELPVHQRGDAVISMVYEANARIRDPVYGCVGAISALQQQVTQLQTQLAVSQAEIVCMRMQQAAMVNNIVNSAPNSSNNTDSKSRTSGLTTSPIISLSSSSSIKASPTEFGQQHFHGSRHLGVESFEAAEPLWTPC